MKYEKKILVMPDVHTKYEKAQRVIDKYQKTHKFVWVGDYFDQFGDTPEVNASTAHWLKTTMESFPDSVYIYGNHDVIYHPNFTCMCSGFSSQKKTAINEVMKIEDWNKLKYFHYENGHWFSHAGITKYWFQHPMKEDITVDGVQRIIDDAVIKLKAGDHSNAIWASSLTRGGNNLVGGIVWEDHNDMELIHNIHQVYGHTPVTRIQTIRDNIINASITNVDTSRLGVYFSEVLEIDEDGNHNKIDTSYL